jgi:hypothetical protein
MRVSLGLGLLLRECKQAIEYEADEVTTETPTYISTSILDIKILVLVLQAVNKVRGSVIHLLKVRDIQQESAIGDKTPIGDGRRGEDGEDGVVEEELRRKLANVSQKLEEQNQRSEKLKEENRKLQEQTKELEEANRLLDIQREVEEKRVAGEQMDEEEAEVEMEEVEVKRTKSAGCRKPSKKAKGDVRRSSRARQPTKKALKA